MAERHEIWRDEGNEKISITPDVQSNNYDNSIQLDLPEMAYSGNSIENNTPLN